MFFCNAHSIIIVHLHLAAQSIFMKKIDNATLALLYYRLKITFIGCKNYHIQEKPTLLVDPQ